MLPTCHILTVVVVTALLSLVSAATNQECRSASQDYSTTLMFCFGSKDPNFMRESLVVGPHPQLRAQPL